MLIADNISCVRGKRSLFSGLGFCLPPGAVLILKGGNGSGKTSLIEILSGQLQPGSGTVTWQGEPVVGNQSLERDLMVIGHESSIDNSLTLREQVQYWAKQYGTETLVKAAMHYYHLQADADTPCGVLSAGTRRKLMLARLIVAPCKLWLLDEPTNFLDEESLLLTVSLIETRINQGGTVIIVSHSMQSAIESHMLWLEDFQSLQA